MFRDYDKVKKMLKGSFDEILDLMDKRRLSYEEVKDLMVKALYKVSKENTKSETINTDYVVETVTVQQALYGPPPVYEVHTIEIPKPEVVEIEMPQVLYGPPPASKVVRVDYNPDLIPGTNIKKPREKRIDETDEEYLEYLDKYYGTHFPEDNKGKARR